MPAAGFVIPATVNLPVGPVASAQVPPLLASVNVTVVPVVVDPVAEQLEKPLVRAMVGVAGTVNALGNSADTVSPAASPEVLTLKFTVQVVTAPVTCDAPENVTLETVA